MQNTQGHGSVLSGASQILDQSSVYKQRMPAKAPCKGPIFLLKDRDSHWQKLMQFSEITLNLQWTNYWTLTRVFGAVSFDLIYVNAVCVYLCLCVSVCLCTCTCLCVHT